MRTIARSAACGIALLCGALSAPISGFAQSAVGDPANYAWQAGAIAHAQRMRIFRDVDTGRQPTPAIIPRDSFDSDPSGSIGSYQPNGPTLTLQNAFFQDLGTNGRTCFTCHAAQNAWSISAASIQARFIASMADPIFRLVDGATCPTADISTIAAKRNAYQLLLSRGLIRIGLPIPGGAEFSVAVTSDYFGCNTDPRTGIATGIVSVYRRPLPSTNLGFLGVGFPPSNDVRMNPTIMWDGREPSLASQAKDATLGHAQAAAAPNDLQLNQILDFETGLFTAQIYDIDAKALNGSKGARGGPTALQQQLSKFYPGVNDPIGLNPRGAAFTPIIFDTYASWESLIGGAALTPEQAAVARGEALFNNTRFNITNVGGLNDALGAPAVPGFCGTCHDSPDVGNHSVKMPLNIGVANAPADSASALLDTRWLPTFTLTCESGPLAGQVFSTTDPGRALISGKCVDIGKFKGPILRGLAARAPYFHNGSAATLLDVVTFYDAKFNLGLSDQQKRDLVAFLKTL